VTNSARAIVVVQTMPALDQAAHVASTMPGVHRLCIDKSGMGPLTFETGNRLFPEGWRSSFTQATTSPPPPCSPMKQRPHPLAQPSVLPCSLSKLVRLAPLRLESEDNRKLREA
jgi:hypothetical protein